jgi:hypothetical protein
VSSVVKSARFGGDRRGHLVQELRIPHAGEADRLREHGDAVTPGDTMERFVPGIVLRNAEALDGGRLVDEEGGSIAR